MMNNLTVYDYIKQHDKTHIIFDFDATLFLLLLPWNKWGETIQGQLLNLNPDIWNQWTQEEISLSEMQNRYIDKHGEAALQIILEHNKRFEEDQLKDVHPHHDLLRAVRELGTAYKKYVWSSNTREIIQRVLADFDIEDAFERVVTRNDVRLLKPNAEGFQLIRDPKVPLERYVLVGDSSSDRGAAKNAGIDFYYVDFFDQRL